MVMAKHKWRKCKGEWVLIPEGWIQREDGLYHAYVHDLRFTFERLADAKAWVEQELKTRRQKLNSYVDRERAIEIVLELARENINHEDADHKAEQETALEIVEGILAADPDKITESWHIDDVKSRDETLTDEECREILANVKRRHDAEQGINWDVIDCHIDMYKTDKEREGRNAEAIKNA